MKIEGFTISLGEGSIEIVQDADNVVIIKDEYGYTVAMIYGEDGEVKVETDFSQSLE